MFLITIKNTSLNEVRHQARVGIDRATEALRAAYVSDGLSADSADIRAMAAIGSLSLKPAVQYATGNGLTLVIQPSQLKQVN